MLACLPVDVVVNFDDFVVVDVVVDVVIMNVVVDAVVFVVVGVVDGCGDVVSDVGFVNYVIVFLVVILLFWWCFDDGFRMFLNLLKLLFVVFWMFAGCFVFWCWWYSYEWKRTGVADCFVVLLLLIMQLFEILIDTFKVGEKF